MSLTKRQRQIISMSLNFFHDYGSMFTGLIKERYVGHRKDNARAWVKLKEEIAELRTQLILKFHSSAPREDSPAPGSSGQPPRPSQPAQDRP